MGRGLFFENNFPPWGGPPWGGGGISADVIWGKKYEKGNKFGRKRKKKERKRNKGKEKENIWEDKGKNKMPNREELRQKGHDGSKKTMCRAEKISFSDSGGGLNKYSFRFKCRHWWTKLQ
jgi:hypothetical protein